MDSDNLFKYIVIIIIIAVVYWKLHINLALLIGILIGIVVVSYLNHNRVNVNETYNAKMFRIMNTTDFKYSKYFVKDVNLLELLYNMSDFKEYNPNSFYDLIKSTDNVLHLEDDVEKGTREPYYDLQIAIENKNKALNYYNTFVLCVPKSMLIKHTNYKEVLDKLLTQHIENMSVLCKKYYINAHKKYDSLSNDINVMFFNDYKNPEGFDKQTIKNTFSFNTGGNW